MLPCDRRLGVRVDLEFFLNQYVMDRPFRALTRNLSETGVYLDRVRLPRCAPAVARAGDVGLEFELPGTGEVIWARGQICYQRADAYVHGTGVRFTAMPRIHARMVRDYCAEVRDRRLSKLLDRIRAA
jgi:hypothetical protein